jgi:hypothetical protein
MARARRARSEGFAELTSARRTKQTERDQIKIETAPQAGDADLLDVMPLINHDANLPEDLERKLYDAFQLQVRYNRTRHEVTLTSHDPPRWLPQPLTGPTRKDTIWPQR